MSVRTLVAVIRLVVVALARRADAAVRDAGRGRGE